MIPQPSGYFGVKFTSWIYLNACRPSLRRGRNACLRLISLFLVTAANVAWDIPVRVIQCKRACERTARPRCTQIESKEPSLENANSVNELLATQSLNYQSWSQRIRLRYRVVEAIEQRGCTEACCWNDRRPQILGDQNRRQLRISVSF